MMKPLDDYQLPQADLAVVLRPGFTFDSFEMTECDRVSYLHFLPITASAVFTPDDGGIFFENQSGKRILVFNKRIHRYQGFSPYETVLPVRIAHKAGVKNILLTNAAGGLKEEQEVGEFVVTRKHIILSPVPSLSPDFDSKIVSQTSRAYDPQFSEALFGIVETVTGRCSYGVYAQVLGPAFETWAEIDYLRNLGADCVGMSTSLEAVWAYLKGIKVVSLSLLTNIHKRDISVALNDSDVLKEIVASQKVFTNILERFIEYILE